MSAKPDSRIRQLKIKTGVLHRTMKEKLLYESDIGREEARLERMTKENFEKENLIHQGKVIEESRMMAQEAIVRLSKAYDDLKSLFEDIVASLPEPLPEKIVPEQVAGDLVTTVDGKPKEEEMDQNLKDILAARDLLQSIQCDPPMDVV